MSKGLDCNIVSSTQETHKMTLWLCLPPPFSPINSLGAAQHANAFVATLVALGKQMIYECEWIQTNRGELQ